MEGRGADFSRILNDKGVGTIRQGEIASKEFDTLKAKIPHQSCDPTRGVNEPSLGEPRLSRLSLFIFGPGSSSSSNPQPRARVEP